ncbi:M48 family metalloprotease [Flavobacterium turcicum]|uniref:M48 family metalloprotease n=1 Tax=Flavobacterium turcicum TaxID=2764718 RepID=A0ABR7JGF0_9FLAO|nr:M48 family metalloprotease [Flavobacterium turcicum]MBC5863547.1 M48 family metalloprotease [Flavobacterium turcicum]NHL02503.1 M48 family metalloprotease [Flavobacterium turcicum]
MKNNLKTSLVLGTFMMCLSSQAQINLKEGALGALSKGVAGFTFSDADAAQLSKAAVTKMDAENTVAGPTDPYTVRLNRVFGKHTKSEGYTLNYKVYKLNEVNAFATADGSVRVYSGLMDIMDDNELLAVIGHEIGHVANSDTKDAIKASYRKEALIGLAASQSEKVAAITDSQLGKIGSSMIDSKHSRKQESEADEFSYNFMKSNGYNVNAVASAFSILAKMSEGSQASFLDKMMSSHPDPKERAENARLRAEIDGLFKPYVQQKPVVKKPVVKKPVAKKKK